MELSPVTVGILVVAALLIVFRMSLSTKGAKKVRRRGVFRGGPGSGTAGAIYEFLNEDKRNAIEIIVDEKGAARDGETADDTVDPPDSPKPPRV